MVVSSEVKLPSNQMQEVVCSTTKTTLEEDSLERTKAYNRKRVSSDRLMLAKTNQFNSLEQHNFREQLKKEQASRSKHQG